MIFYYYNNYVIHIGFKIKKKYKLQINEVKKVINHK